jgi:hypothetical protein
MEVAKVKYTLCLKYKDRYEQAQIQAKRTASSEQGWIQTKSRDLS